jgi:hypothetical protein
MIEKIEAHRIKCDGCGRYFPGEYGEGFLFCTTEEDLITWISEDVEWKEVDGKYYCFGCSFEWCPECGNEIKPRGGICEECGYGKEK